MKYCINCAHYDASELDAGRHPICLHSRATVTNIDPVSGSTTRFQNECRIMRQKYFACGDEASLFEPKPTTPSTL
jgi:hypothetical protein